MNPNTTSSNTYTLSNCIEPNIGKLLRRKQFLAAAVGYCAPRRNIVIQACYCHNHTNQQIKFGLTASRRVGNAVLRNRARRRMRHAAQLCLPSLGVTGSNYVFIARYNTTSCSWDELLGDIRSALKYLQRKLKPPEQTQF